MVFNKLMRILRGREEKAADSATDSICEISTQEPRILGLSMVKNEQDIIEPFIRHNIQFLGAFVIMDNKSVDDTRNIMLACARDLNNVIVSDSNEFGYNQSERMTRLLQYCQSAFFADYILFLDADEFISAPDRTSLVRTLETIPSIGVGRMPWRTFVIKPGQEDAVAGDAPRAFTHRRREERPQFYKAALRLDGSYVPDLTVRQGNHDVELGGAAMNGVTLDLPLLHYPVRSAAQLASKSAVGWTAYLAMNPKAHESGEGFQWREAFDRLSHGGMPAVIANLATASMEYAQQAITIDWDQDAVAEAPAYAYERRYSSGCFLDPLSSIARSWERSLVASPPVVKLERPAGGSEGSGITATSFDASWHWDHLFFDVQPFRFLAEKHEPADVLDIGCGIGQYLALFKAMGAKEVFGIDGVPPEATHGVLEPGEYASQDLTKPIDLGRKFSLVVCVEVAEHLDAEAGATLLDTIERHAGQRIVFSAAEPNQPGNGHINCQPLAYWLEQWAQRGWVPDLIDSLGIRALSTMSWFRRNLVVLRQGSREQGRAATDALLAIAAKPYAWYGQAPGVRETAFTEPLFGPGEGYHPALNATES